MRHLHCTSLALVLTLAAGCGSTAGRRSDTTVPSTVPSTVPTTTSAPSDAPELTAAQARERARVQLSSKPWTDTFQATAMLLADRIRIEGPVGLVNHVVVRGDDALFRRTNETLPEGFLQRTVPLRTTTESTDQTYLVRGQLDAWQLTALVELVVLERPGDVPVTVIAEGHVVWRDRDGAERRENRIVWTGPIGQVARPSAASAERE
ncbi:MAG: hypothetical protein V3T22_07370 [Planctomycetota bacterium]